MNEGFDPRQEHVHGWDGGWGGDTNADLEGILRFAHGPNVDSVRPFIEPGEESVHLLLDRFEGLRRAAREQTIMDVKLDLVETEA